MELGIVITTNEPETVWNAFRLANFSRSKGDEVSIFLVGKGVEYGKTSGGKFDAVAEVGKLVQAGGKIMACGTCLELRGEKGGALCPMSSLKDLYALVEKSDRVVTF